MAAKWSDLSDRQRAIIRVWTVAELALKVAALIDISRRPTEGIRGSKRLWRAVIVVYLIGPLSYFAFGRKRC